MTFLPLKQVHAIHEAVFGFNLSAPLSPEVLQNVLSNHGLWKDELPRAAPMSDFQFTLGDAGHSTMHIPVTGVVFDEVKRDGTLAWRLSVMGNTIHVNCLDYSRWEQVWSTARRFLKRLLDVGFGDGNVAVVGCQHQVIDVFYWQGAVETYDASLLFNPNSPYLNAPILTRGPLWHHHQGWYRADSLPAKALRVLERVHIDGAPFLHYPASVRVDVFQGLDFSEPIEFEQFLQRECLEYFKYLHACNKDFMRNLLTSDMARLIRLDNADR